MTEKKPRWSTAKKASVKKAKSEKARSAKSGTFGEGPPGKKPRWVDGAPARPAAADRGKPRWARDDATVREDGGRSRGDRAYGRDDRAYAGRDERGGSDARERGDRSSYRSRDDRPTAGRDDRGRNDRGAGGGYRSREARPTDRGRDEHGGSRSRDERPSYRDRDDRDSGSGGYRGRGDRSGYRDRDDRGGGGYRGRDERPSYRGRDDRDSGNGGGGYRGRDERPSYRDRDDRDSGSGGYRGRGDRSGYRDRDERPGYRARDDQRGDGGGHRRGDDRPSDRGRAERGGHRGRDDHSSDGDHRRNDNRGYRGTDDRRASGGRDDRANERGREDRPRYRDRDEQARGDRPAYGNEGERRDGRDRYDRDTGRGRDDRRDLSQRDDRPTFGERGPRRPTGRYSDGPHHEPRPVRADRVRGQWGADSLRPADRGDTLSERVQQPAEQRETRVDSDAASPGEPATTVDAASATGPEPTPQSGPGFAHLGLPVPIVKALAARGIRAPFPIQAATIPDALAAKDLLGRGRTGSGKTMAFGLPTLARLSQGRATPNRPRALVLVPTRELALQVADALEPISRAVGVSQKVVAGGMPYPPQLTALDRGVDLVVATPGRLQDLIERGAAILDNVEIVVLDEADHMADLGFLPEVTEIMDLVPEGGQRLLFSATLDKGIDELAQKYLVDPVTHSTDDPTATVTTMEHRVLLIEPSMKKTLTAQISGRPGRTLVFVRTQLGADRVASQLRESGILAGPIHGGLNQSVRNKVLEAFKDGRLQVLVATDVAARGIHVDDVTQVVQVDPPADHKTYVHRAGRTARAGSEGSVVTLALPHQRKAMERIIDEVALSIRPERLDARSAADEGVEPTGAPVPESVWQDIIAPRPSTRFKGRGRGPGRPRPDGGLRPRRRF